jgi:hypothetical protein
MTSPQAATSGFHITQSIYVAAVAAVVLVPRTFFLRTFSARWRPASVLIDRFDNLGRSPLPSHPVA